MVLFISPAMLRPINLCVVHYSIVNNISTLERNSDSWWETNKAIFCYRPYDCQRQIIGISLFKIYPRLKGGNSLLVIVILNFKGGGGFLLYFLIQSKFVKGDAPRIIFMHRT